MQMLSIPVRAHAAAKGYGREAGLAQQLEADIGIRAAAEDPPVQDHVTGIDRHVNLAVLHARPTARQNSDSPSPGNAI
jgi:hypothetical protein